MGTGHSRKLNQRNLRRRITIIHKGGKVHTWCEDLHAGFRQAGCDTGVIALRDRSAEERRTQRKTGAKYFENPATIARIAATVRQQRPDLLVLLNSVGLPESANDQIRSAAPNTPLISWLADHIPVFPTETTPSLDAIYYFDSATLPVLRTAYTGDEVRLEFLPLAADPQRFPSHALPWARRKSGLVFIGNNTPSRRHIIRELQRLTTVDPYGPRAEAGWPFWRRRRFTPAASARLYGSYQAVLNMLQPPNTIHGLNLRAFEVPLCGGLGTYPDTPDLATSFVPGEEIIAYESNADLANQLQNILTDPQRAEAITQAGRERVLKDHTYLERARRLLRDWPA